MKNTSKLSYLMRSIAIFGAVAVVTTGATFAALQSPNALLTGNTIESVSADLRIGTSTSSFSTSRVGFDFNSIVPGGPAGPTAGNTLYVKNYGTANLSIKVAISSTPNNLNNTNLSKTYLHITRTDSGPGTDMSVPLSTLISSYATGGTAINDTIAAGVTATYVLRISMDADAVTSTSAAISAVDFAFSGVAI